MTGISTLQTILAILLVITILLQQRGTGIGGAIGGQDSSVSTRRGSEKILYQATIIIAFLFIGVSIIRLLI